MPIAIKPAVRPTWMVPGMNGEIPDSHLTTIEVPKTGLIKLEKQTARQFQYLRVVVNRDLKEAGLAHLELSVVSKPDAYRTARVITAVFFDRMTTNPLLARIPWETRKYLGKTWWLKAGKSPCAAPEWFNPVTGQWEGGSNHGWAIAADCCFYNKQTGQTVNIASAGRRAWEIFRDHVQEAGFSWEGKIPTNPQWVPGQAAPKSWEPWHVRNCVNVIPDVVIKMEQFFAQLAKGQ